MVTENGDDLLEQFPRRIQITLGGCPSKKLRSWKSASFDTIANPCWAAPDGVVIGSLQAGVLDMRRARVEVHEDGDETG